jgi:hypothetical protein
MKLKFILIGFVLISLGCVQKDSLTFCPAVICETEFKQIKLEIVSQSGQNLIASAPNVILNQVIVYSNRLKRNLEIDVDTSKRFIVFYTYGSDEFIITYKSTTPDNLKVETKFNPEDCCGVLDITKLTLNNNSINFNNAGPTTIILKK